MSRSRLYDLMALKEGIALNAYRREAARLHEEIARLESRRMQIVELDQGYREHLALPDLVGRECHDVMQIVARLRERREVDSARLEILLVERDRLARLLAAQQRKIEKLQDEARAAKRVERHARDERAAALVPARRTSGT